jgi:hypothetical protein
MLLSMKAAILTLFSVAPVTAQFLIPNWPQEISLFSGEEQPGPGCHDPGFPAFQF